MLRQVATPESAIEELCAGRGADLLLAEASLDIDWPIRALGRERIVIPVVAYGNATDDHAGVVAITAGATEFLRLPADPELIAAILVKCRRRAA